MEAKYHNDPQWRRRLIDASMACRKRRWQEKPEYRDRFMAASLARYYQSAKEESYMRTRRFLRWCYSHDWVRHKLPWKSSRPRLYPEKVKHHCAGCKFMTKNGYKLWWIPIDRSLDHEQRSGIGPEEPSATERYMCCSCYVKTGWKNMTPQGFEDITTIGGLRARARELGIDIGEELEQEKHVSGRSLQKQDTAQEPKI
jgi:hypothetical protein